MIEVLFLSALLLSPPQADVVIVNEDPVEEDVVLVEVTDEPIKLEMLTIDLRTLERITEMARDIDEHDGLMMRIVNDRIRDLREPRPDGSYKWASLKREEASRDRVEEEIER
ncbi:MAG: hypothetical protein R3338_09875, partial [Thermoanaerobaculia bacterium]|nr:hypothetical protein [Thermoanaerobaculia bacterium]